MRKVFKMQDLECANCAAKMEAEINRLDGVRSATMSFMTQKFTLEADDEGFEAIVDACQRICSKYEPDCRIVR